MMGKAIFYSLFLFTLVSSCNQAAYIPPTYKLHQDTNRASKEIVEEVETHEEKNLEVVPIPDAARDLIMDRYIQFTFGRGVNEPNTLGEIPFVEAK